MQTKSASVFKALTDWVRAISPGNMACVSVVSAIIASDRMPIHKGMARWSFPGWVV